MTDKPNTDLIKYYSLRAGHYDEKFQRGEPARMAEQADLISGLQNMFAGQRVLEIACGTGFWTQVLAETAAHITALDASENALAAARTKGIPAEKVTFIQGDAISLDNIGGTFGGIVMNFWLSHLPRNSLPAYLRQVSEFLEPGGIIFAADDVYIPGVGGELIGEKEEDSHKLRKLPDGSEHKILKNYFTETQLRDMFSQFSEIKVEMGECYWRLNGRK